MRRILRDAFFLAGALALGMAPAAAQPKGEPVKLGLIDIYSGGFAFIADSIRTGFQIAVDEANAAGGLKGRPFQVVTADMGGSVEKAVTEGRRMILEEKIKYVTVGIHSGAAVAVGALGKEHKVLINGGFATTKRLTGEAGHDYVARANLSTVEIGRVMAEHLKSRPDIKRVSVISPDYEYGQHFMADFVAGLKVARPDITVVRQELHKLGATDFGPHVTALQAQPVDLVVGGMFGADLVNFLRSARDFGLFSGKTQFFTHGLDLAKMGALKDSLPPNTHGHRVVSVLCHRYRQVEVVHRRDREAHEDLSHRLDARSATSPARCSSRRSARRARDDVEVVRKALGTVSVRRPDRPHQGARLRQHGAVQLLRRHREARREAAGRHRHGRRQGDQHRDRGAQLRRGDEGARRRLAVGGVTRS